VLDVKTVIPNGFFAHAPRTVKIQWVHSAD